MCQVTIVWNGAEIGYGEGESYQYAKQEAVESVSDIYLGTESEWELSVVRS